MLELADTARLVSRLGEAGRRLAEGLSWERTAAATERHLTDIIEGSAVR
jgi:hypothetical protein